MSSRVGSFFLNDSFGNILTDYDCRLTTNMLDALGETYSMLVAFYLAARLFMAAYYFCLAWVIPMVRGMMLVHVGLTILPSVLWIGSIYVDMPQRLAVIWVAILVELTGAMFVVLVIRSSKMLPKPIAEWVDRVFEFFPAINIEHKVERTNAFVTLVFGYSVVAIIYQNSASFGLNAFFGKAALGLVQAFCFNWIILNSTAPISIRMQFVGTLLLASYESIISRTIC
jgi:low temperature requirement protein LtrA